MKEKNKLTSLKLKVYPLSEKMLFLVRGGVSPHHDGKVGDAGRTGSPSSGQVCECVCAVCPER